MTFRDSNSVTLKHLQIAVTHLRGLGRYWPVAAVVAVAVVIRSLSWLNCDDSWLLTLGERLLAGARPYVDFTEPNPPASILMYIPAIIVGQVFDIEPEAVVTILVFAAALVSLWLAGRILLRAGLLQPFAAPAMFAFGCLFFLVLPGDAFAQREHVALLAILPILAVYAARASGAELEVATASLAGIGGGVAVAIKPHFALALLFPLAFLFWTQRFDPRSIARAVFSPENLAAALVTLAYAVLVFWQFSDYIRHTLPMVFVLYVPLRHTLLYMIENPPVLLAAMAIIVSAGLDMHHVRTSAVVVFALAILGFVIAFIIQGKAWPYQGYPAIALSLLVLAASLVRRLSGLIPGSGMAAPSLVDAAFGIVLFAGIYALASVWFLFQPNEANLVREVARLVPAHPKILSLSDGPELAFPLTRKLQGTPLGRSPFQWISQNADGVLVSEQLDPVTRSKIEEYERADRNELVNTIQSGHPDVILIGGQIEHQWAFSYPEIVQALRPYRWAKTVDKIEIWLPRTAADPYQR